MKKTIFTAAAALMVAATAGASSVIVNFASSASSGTIVENGTGTAQNPILDNGFVLNQVTNGNSGASSVNMALLDTTGAASGITLTGTIREGMGTGGTLPTTALTSNTMLNMMFSDLDNAWRGGVNSNSTASTLNLTITAGTTYEITLLSARANTWNSATNGSYTLSVASGAVSSLQNIIRTDAGNNGWQDGGAATGILTGGSAEGLNATAITWKFTATKDGSVNLLSSANHNLNLLKITTTATPEPATASLSLLGLAALMMRRRRA